MNGPITILQFAFVCWVIFVLYWMISAGTVKPIEKTSGWLAGNWYTLLFLIGFGFIVSFRPLSRLGLPVGELSSVLLPHSLFINFLAAVLLGTGLIVAIAARRTLASNWSSQVAIKEGHELITRGLYRYVRNPIYTGNLLMALGTVLAFGTLGAVIGFIIVGFGFYLKISDEERILTRHFGAEYSSYRQHTKALIPFL